MTLVTKSIKGSDYLYYQDWIKTNGKGTTVTTLICRADIDQKKILDAKGQAFAKHSLNVSRASNIIKKTPYHIENVKMDEETKDRLELFKFLSGVFWKNISPFDKNQFYNNIYTRYVHGTTAIEGNTLTEDEAKKVLNTERTVDNKPIRDTIEVLNYNSTRKFFEKYNGGITENLIKNVHVLLLVGITDNFGKQTPLGKYRDSRVILRHINFIPPKAELVPESLVYLLREYNDGIKKNIHPIELASFFHQRFEEIHPFSDGNGRVGREILNYMLKQSGYPVVYILEKHKAEYLSALEKGNQQDYQPLFDFLVSRIHSTMKYFYAKTIVYEVLTSKSFKKSVKESDYEDVYEKVLSGLKELRDSSEMP